MIMFDRSRTIGVLKPAFAVALAAFTLLFSACASESAGPEPFEARASARSSAPKASGDVGTARRRAEGEHCCYEGTYQRCPNAAACFGGVELEACVAKCAGDARCLTNVCTSELRHAPPPKGCSPSEAPASFPCN
jgi:hypothetical protein